MNNGNNIYNFDGLSPYYVAEVQLPHGATVTRLTFYFYDPSSYSLDQCGVYLNRTSFDGSEVAMAFAASDNSGAGSTYDDTINNGLIDNSQYSYYLDLYMLTSVVSAYGVVIEYKYPVSLPAILK